MPAPSPAAALGGRDQLDDELCSTVLSAVIRLEDGLDFGIVAVGQATERDDAQTRLLDVAGRAP